METKQVDVIGACFWLLMGLLICEESYRFGLGVFHRPGPGFLPFLSGIVLAVLALLVLVGAVAKKGEEKRDFGKGGSRRHKVAIAVVLILGYPALLTWLGFFLATFLLIGLLSVFIYPRKWRAVGVYALCASLGAYLVFQIALKVEFPKGFLGF